MSKTEILFNFKWNKHSVLSYCSFRALWTDLQTLSKPSNARFYIFYILLLICSCKFTVFKMLLWNDSIICCWLQIVTKWQYNLLRNTIVSFPNDRVFYNTSVSFWSELNPVLLPGALFVWSALDKQTGSNSDQKAIDVCITRNKFERRQFVTNNKLYYHFVTTCNQQQIIFFFHWHYSPLLALACLTIVDVIYFTAEVWNVKLTCLQKAGSIPKQWNTIHNSITNFSKKKNNIILQTIHFFQVLSLGVSWPNFFLHFLFPGPTHTFIWTPGEQLKRCYLLFTLISQPSCHFPSFRSKYPPHFCSMNQTS